MSNLCDLSWSGPFVGDGGATRAAGGRGRPIQVACFIPQIAIGYRGSYFKLGGLCW